MLMRSAIAVAFVFLFNTYSVLLYADMHWLVGWNYWFEFVFQSGSASPAREQINTTAATSHGIIC